MENREKMIELLTGVQSSKRNYYTELKKTVNELQKKNIQLEIINEVMKSFNVEMTIDEMLKNVLEKLKTIFPIERISLSLTIGKELILSNVYPVELFHIAPGSPIPKKQSLYWHVLRTGRPYFYLTGSGQGDKRWYEEDSFEKMGLVSNLLFPLTRKGKVSGILALGSQEKIENYPPDISFFQQLSDQLAVCMENTRLFQEVLNTKKLWEETFQAVSDAIFIVDLEGNILQANDAAHNCFLKKRGAARQNIQSLLFPQEERLFKETILTKSTSTGELLIGKKVFEWNCYPIFDEVNTLYASIIYLKDVTAKRRIETQLLQSGKLAAIGEMAAGVAHELNNPLTAIMGNSQLLLRKLEMDPSHKKLLADIYECGKRSKNIIQNLLTFSRQEEYLFEKCSVNEAITQVLGLIGNQLQKQAIQIETDLDDSLPLIEGSSQQISQIILNLLLNAKDALEEAHQKDRKIILRTCKQTIDGSNVLVLAVEDNGSGIEEAVISEIFHPFYTTKNASKGYGLGLSVSLGIAEAHGGTLQAESIPGKGSVFKLILPIQ
ncbi:histidine kinase dimerization/phospho-acceptor domain-containing protein [Neobacillus sp. OS1-32]|uniref:ATP-binding protein n=1 Tax=Neobacillus sp. OS1-32 TaxID=3070682 RepID=UPI0027DFB989|nr:ATP-binding protein [Neobacillus sp. OS1-32]WML28609.1 histidine kinase dimerization/phospho-acceptor domain-containing protein [Neobacillus sp. OS1-32]